MRLPGPERQDGFRSDLQVVRVQIASQKHLTDQKVGVECAALVEQRLLTESLFNKLESSNSCGCLLDGWMIDRLSANASYSVNSSSLFARLSQV